MVRRRCATARQAEARALGVVLGREEGLEDPPPDLRTHADARVRDLDLEVGPRLEVQGQAAGGGAEPLESGGSAGLPAER